MGPLFKRDRIAVTHPSGPEVLQPVDGLEPAVSIGETPDTIEDARVLGMLQGRLASIRERRKEPQREVGVIYLTAGFALIRTHRPNTQS